VRCAACCRKRHRNGATSYCHRMLARALVYPDYRVVFPVVPEMIQNEDGTSENDCEINAARRFLEGFRRKHPHPETVVRQDGPASKGLLYILGAKRRDRGFLYDRAKDHPVARTPKKTERTKKGRTAHEFRWPGDAPLNESQFHMRGDLLVCAEARPDGSKTSWSRAADLPLDKTTANRAVRPARSRWHIEYETVNALKNRGCEFEHNFGHGKNLSSAFATLCLLAFLIDQVLERRCAVLKKGEAVPGSQALSLAGAEALLRQGQVAGPGNPLAHDGDARTRNRS
ncbi:MAG: hypothetical protein OXN84_13845, partial [Albidovulum sp.]|nr:hypothetical protein [Albidovulum sp.]